MKWKTKEGKIIDTKEMTTNHLINCINLIKRTFPKGWEAFYEIPSFNKTYIDEIITRKEAMKESGYFKLLAELKKRT